MITYGNLSVLARIIEENKSNVTSPVDGLALLMSYRRALEFAKDLESMIAVVTDEINEKLAELGKDYGLSEGEDTSKLSDADKAALAEQRSVLVDEANRRIEELAGQAVAGFEPVTSKLLTSCGIRLSLEQLAALGDAVQ